MAFDKKFNECSRLVQILLLLIPIVNWVTEILVRVSAFIRKPNLKTTLGLIFGVILGVGLGWLDLIWVLLFNHLCLA